LQYLKKKIFEIQLAIAFLFEKFERNLFALTILSLLKQKSFKKF
jgi:hypothetical protein